MKQKEKKVQKSVMQVQSCCFAILTQCVFAILVAIAAIVA